MIAVYRVTYRIGKDGPINTRILFAEVEDSCVSSVVATIQKALQIPTESSANFFGRIMKADMTVRLTSIEFLGEPERLPEKESNDGK